MRRTVTGTTVAAVLAAGSAAGQVHQVRTGDTLERLGRRYGIPIATLAAANDIEDPDHIVAGTRLVLPAVGRAAPGPPSPAFQPPPPPGPRPVRIPPDRARLRLYFVRFSRAAGVPADLAMALAWQESGWQRGVVSPTRAVGVMQLMPDTVEFVSRILLRLPRSLDPADPAANIRMGTRFLRYLLDRTGGDVNAAVASYYQGLRSVRERGPLPETLRFVANVRALRGRFQV